MALIKCPDCGRDVSDVAPACPGCGRPIAGASVKPSVYQEGAVVRTQGAGARDKLVGLLLCLAGVVSMATGFSLGGGAWKAVGVIGFVGLVAGLVMFIRGRLQDG